MLSMSLSSVTGLAVPSLALAHQHAAIGPARARAAIRCALIDAPPPDGFEWSNIVLELEEENETATTTTTAAAAASSSTEPDDAMRLGALHQQMHLVTDAAPAAEVAETKGVVTPTAPAAASSSSSSAASASAAAAAVKSWYDSGIRLEKPVTVESWYDSGVRLEYVTPIEPLPLSPAPPPANLAYHPDIDELVIRERIGEGQQSEVLLGELPGDAGQVAVKVGLRLNAIDREAAVLSVMSGKPGFPVMLHHEAQGVQWAGGFLVIELLGPSLKDLLPPNKHLAGKTLLRVGRGLLRLLQDLHEAGFVHNDVKPANILLGADSTAKPTGLHLIDFGSVTPVGDRTPRKGAIGSPLFCSLAADDPFRTLRAVDDLESLAYNLVYLAAGKVPWQGKPDAEVAAMKQELLSGSEKAVDGLVASVECDESATAIRTLWAEVIRSAGTSIDYGACLSALGGGSEDDALSELSFVAAAFAEEFEEQARV